MTKDLIKYLISYYQDFVSKIKFEKRVDSNLKVYHP